MKKFIYSILALFLFNSFCFSQVKKQVRTEAETQKIIEQRALKNQEKLAETNKINVSNLMSNDFSSLYFTIENGSKHQYQKIDLNDENSKNWKRDIVWENIPVNTAYAKYEISLLPFPANYNTAFTGVIRTGKITIKTGQKNLNYTLNYNDKQSDYGTTKSISNSNLLDLKSKNENLIYTSKESEKKHLERNNKTLLQKDASKMISNYNKSFNEPFFPKNSIMNLMGNGTRKFYIRIIPFNTKNEPLKAISNEIVVEEQLIKTENSWDYTVSNEVAKDYTITNLKYVPVKYEEAKNSGCVVVTGYNDKHATSEEMKKYYQKEYPIGKIIYPDDVKEKAWYKKNFGNAKSFKNDLELFSSKFYNELTDYINKNALESFCIEEKNNKNFCQIKVQRAFEYAITTTGITPKTNGIENWLKKCEDQIIPIALDRLIQTIDLKNNTNFRVKATNMFKDFINTYVNKGIILKEFLILKPVTQFENAYLEIEVTKTSNSNLTLDNIVFSIANKTFGNYVQSDKTTTNEESIYLEHNLFENTSVTVPNLENIGDKTIVYLVLKPQESFVLHDGNKFINKITNNKPSLENSKKSSYENFANSTGFKILNSKDFSTQFFFGIKVDEKVSTSYINK